MSPLRRHKRKPASVWLDTLQDKDKEVRSESEQDRNDYLLNRLRPGSAVGRKYFVTKKVSKKESGDDGVRAVDSNTQSATYKDDSSTVKMVDCMTLEKFDRGKNANTREMLLLQAGIIVDYCANDCLLRYVLTVIMEKRQIIRKQIPKLNRAFIPCSRTEAE